MLSTHRELSSFISDVKTVYEQPAPILEYAWYPGATASQPGTYCFLASVRDCPVKLLDAGDKRVR